MIKASELRLGNYFRDRLTGRILIVDTLSKDQIIFDQQGDALPDGWQAEPIPIAEEWLIKFGFEETMNHGICNWRLSIGNEYIAPHGDNRYELISSSIPDKEVADYCSYTVNDYWAAKRCNYVHQLQNLYFAVTGHELTLIEQS